MIPIARQVRRSRGISVLLSHLVENEEFQALFRTLESRTIEHLSFKPYLAYIVQV